MKLQTPTWSPDGKWIAFVSGAKIYKMPFLNGEFDTTNVVQLTKNGNNYFPSWSPDGRWIVFDSNNESPNGMQFIWKMENDGSNKIRIAYEPQSGEIRAPNWSSNNKIFHFCYSPNFNSSEIYMMNNSGNDTTRLTFNNFTDYYPNCSINNIVAFSSNNNSGNPSQIWTTNLLNDTPKQLTYNGIVGTFSFSPDNDKIVYTQSSSIIRYDDSALWVIDINSGFTKQLTFN